jgi:lycopene beta-cyclase
MIIVGGGLWGSLLAYRLRQVRPEVAFELHEAGPTLGGNKTWSFHQTDVSASNFAWLAPFIRSSWSGYHVKFPQYSRFIETPYHSISSERLHELVNGKNVHLNSTVIPDGFFIDARGVSASVKCGWQKFVGHEVSYEDGHGFTHPVLMDATVEQIDGFRFIYYLPFDANRLLIEDTRYSSNPEMNFPERDSLRREEGKLPIPFEETHSHETSLGGIFQDTTGYSLPDAVRVIELLVQSDLKETTVKKILADYRKSRRWDRAYFRLLNRLMFKACLPAQRYKVLEHFYKLPLPLIQRFYRGEMTMGDRLRLFKGKPPVPVKAAFRSLVYD